MEPEILPPVEGVDPLRLTAVLEAAGWRLVGGRTGVYNRLAPPDLRGVGAIGNLIVPLDRQAPEYADLLTAALVEVSGSAPADLWHRVIRPRMVAGNTDQFNFRRATDAPSGLIPWTQGEMLIQSVRGTLAAGAKSYVEKMRRFSNKLGQFSGRYLDTIFMGQTAVGSYIVTAYAPTDAQIPVYSNFANSNPGDWIASGRDVTRSLSDALEATVEAIGHFHRTESLAAFEDGVNRGISLELSSSLEEFVGGAEESDITIVWEDGAELIGIDQREPRRSSFRFERRDASALSRAAHYFAQEAVNVTHETVVGRVYVASKKEPGAPGVFGLELSHGPVNKVRVRLRDEREYRFATRALDEDLILAVAGELERDANLSWLYNARILAVSESEADARAAVGLTSLDTQPSLFDELGDPD